MSEATVPAHEPLVEAALARLRPDVSGGSRAEIAEILRAVVRLGYLPVVDEIDGAIEVKDKRVLEVGCGNCWYAPLLLARGARSFGGLDIELFPDERRIQDRVSTPGYHYDDAAFEEMPFDLETFLHAFEDIDVRKTDVLNAPWPDGSFDAIFMITVTEHLFDPRNVFRKVHGLLAPGGRLYFSHNNYYCWNGHHLPPKFVRDLDPENPEHVAVADWGHVRRLVRNTDPSHDYLNHIRIHELMAIVTELFEVEQMWTAESGEETGRDRLTPEIERELAAYHRSELLTEMVYATCLRREEVDAPSAADAVADQEMEEHTARIDIRWSKHDEGFCYRTRIPTVCSLSKLILLEDEQVLGLADAAHSEIRELGEGRYSVWGNYLYFSTSDNTDPATNGRRYVLRDARTL